MFFVYKYLNRILLKSVKFRRSMLVALDSFLIFFSLIFSNYFITNSLFYGENLIFKIAVYLLIGILIFILSGQYKAITMYVGGNLFYKSLIRNISLILIMYLLGFLDKRFFLSIKFFALNFILLTSLIVGSRLFLRDLLYRLNLFKQKKPNVIIYGAGNAGAQLASSIQISGKYKVLGFIDEKSK